jgi:hypothetical protein
VWGSRAGPQNQRRFDVMSAGDDVLIVVGDSTGESGR